MKKLYNQQEMAKLFHVTPRTIFNWEKRGILSRCKLPGCWYLRQEIVKILGEGFDRRKEDSQKTH